MSQPPEYPGSRRIKRAAASAGSSAYQGVFEAVGSILIACAAGFWIDRRFETAPVGVLVGAAVGFGAFVLRLVRLGKELHPDAGTAGLAGAPAPTEDDVAEDSGFAGGIGLSDALREDDEGRMRGDREQGDVPNASDEKRNE